MVGRCVGGGDFAFSLLIPNIKKELDCIRLSFHGMNPGHQWNGPALDQRCENAS